MTAKNCFADYYVHLISHGLHPYAVTAVSPVGSVGASACGRGVHQTPAPLKGKANATHIASDFRFQIIDAG